MSKILTDGQWIQMSAALAQAQTLLAAATDAPAPGGGTAPPPPPAGSGVVPLTFRWIPGGIDSPGIPAFGDQILAVQFTTGPSPGTGKITFADQANAAHVCSLTTVPGLISLSGPPGFDPRYLAQLAGPGATVGFSVGPNTRRLVVLQPNTTYWFNVANWDMAGQQYVSPGPMFLSLYAP